MLDPNQITELGQTAQVIKTQLNPWLPALAIAAGWAGRELNRACTSAKSGAEWLLSHGGLLKLIVKLFWN